MTRIFIKGSPSIVSRGVRHLLADLAITGSTLEFILSDPHGGPVPTKTDITVLVISSRGGYLPQLLSDVGPGSGASARYLIYYHESRISSVLRFLAQGALGFVSQQSSPDQLIQCFHEVIAYRHYYCQRSTGLLFNFYMSAIIATGHSHLAFFLSPREREILSLLLEGCTVKQISARLDIHVSTVSGLKQKAMQKLGARNLTKLLTLLKDFNIPLNYNND